MLIVELSTVNHFRRIPLSSRADHHVISKHGNYIHRHGHVTRCLRCPSKFEVQQNELLYLNDRVAVLTGRGIASAICLHVIKILLRRSEAAVKLLKGLPIVCLQ